VKGNPLWSSAREVESPAAEDGLDDSMRPPTPAASFPEGKFPHPVGVDLVLGVESETARHKFGLQALITWLLNAMPLLSIRLTRSALEPTSMDLE